MDPAGYQYWPSEAEVEAARLAAEAAPHVILVMSPGQWSMAIALMVLILLHLINRTI